MEQTRPKLKTNLDTNLLKLLSALIVALFLAIPYWKGRLHAKGAK